MRQAGVHVDFRLDAVFLAQDAVVDEGLVAQRVEAADLEVGWGQVCVAVGGGEDVEEGRLVVGFVAGHEHVDRGLGQDGRVFVLLVREGEGLVFGWEFRVGYDGWDGEVLPRQWWGEVGVAREVGEDRADVAAGGCAADEEAFGGVGAEGGGVGCGPLEGVPGVVDGVGEGEFRAQAVGGADADGAKGLDEAAAALLFAFGPADAEAAAVVHDDEGAAGGWGAGGLVEFCAHLFPVARGVVDFGLFERGWGVAQGFEAGRHALFGHLFEVV